MKRLFSTALFAVTTLFASASHAAIVTWTLQGDVTAVAAGFESYFGSTITATITFDTDSAGVGGSYDNAILSSNITSTNGGFTLNLNSGASDPSNISLADTTLDTLNMQVDLLSGNIPSIPTYNFDWDFLSDTTGPFSSTALSELIDASTVNSELADGFGNSFRIRNGSSGQVLLDSEITSVSSQISAVPLPAGVWLFGSAIAGLMGFRAKKP